MPVVFSRLSQVRRATVTVLAARAGLSGVQIAYSWPGRNTEDEAIWTAPPLDADVLIPVFHGSRQQVEENFGFVVVFQAVKAEGDVEAALNRCLEMAGEFQDALQDDVRLGLTSAVISWAKIEGWDVVEGIADRGPAARIEVDVKVRARLS